MTKICQKLEWVRPYLEAGLEVISKNHKIDRVGAWTLGKSRGIGEHAALIQRKKGEGYRVWIHTHFYDQNDKKLPFSKIDILKMLAHELAHCDEWRHTPRHSILEAEITQRMMDLLKLDGYISEEEELNQKGR